jgi:hypothetical protein
VADPVQPFASVAVTVKEKFPGSNGVPASSPEPEKASPGGNVPPVIANANGAVPELAANCWPYGTPTAAGNRETGVMVSVAHTLSVNAWDVEHPFESVAVTVNEKLPVRVGAPEKAPEGRSVSPGGSPALAVNVYGPAPPATAVIAWL